MTENILVDDSMLRMKGIVDFIQTFSAKLKHWATVTLTEGARRHIYTVIATAIPVFIALGFLTDSLAGLILNLVAALLGVGASFLAIPNSASKWRTWLYSVVAAGLPILVLFDWLSGDLAAGVLAIIGAALGVGGSVTAAVTVHDKKVSG